MQKIWSICQQNITIQNKLVQHYVSFKTNPTIGTILSAQKLVKFGFDNYDYL